MKIIQPGFEEIKSNNAQKHIELIARTCYKSNDLITEDSNKKFIKNLVDRKHWAMLEHFIFVYQASESHSNDFDALADEKYICSTRTLITSSDMSMSKICSNRSDCARRNIISFSARSLLDLLDKYHDNDYLTTVVTELIEQVVADYDCVELFGGKFEKTIRTKWVNISDISILTPKEQLMHGWHSIKFTCDRGVSHEIVRHRDASFAQESTRYCNYSKDKFDNSIAVIKPFMFNNEAELNSVERKKYDIWKKSIDASESAYFDLLLSGATPQEARSVLPNSLKTEVIMTARNYEWAHFFELRCDVAAHPQMRELACPLFNYFNNDNSILFNRDNVIFKD